MRVLASLGERHLSSNGTASQHHIRPRSATPSFSTCTSLLLSTAAMAQIRGTAGYHLGNQSPFGNAGRNDGTTNDPSPLDQLREQTNKIEDFLDTLSDPIKP